MWTDFECLISEIEMTELKIECKINEVKNCKENEWIRNLVIKMCKIKVL